MTNRSIVWRLQSMIGGTDVEAAGLLTGGFDAVPSGRGARLF